MRPAQHQLDYCPPRRWQFTRADFLIYGCLLLAALVVVALVIPKFTTRSVDGGDRRTRLDISALNSAIEIFKSDNGRYPSASEGLAALAIAPTGCQNWKGPYVNKPIVVDVWGHPFVYRVPGSRNPQAFDVFSAGPDGKAGTSDDIGNWMSN